MPGPHASDTLTGQYERLVAEKRALENKLHGLEVELDRLRSSPARCISGKNGETIASLDGFHKTGSGKLGIRRGGTPELKDRDNSHSKKHNRKSNSLACSGERGGRGGGHASAPTVLNMGANLNVLDSNQSCWTTVDTILSTGSSVLWDCIEEEPPLGFSGKRSKLLTTQFDMKLGGGSADSKFCSNSGGDRRTEESRKRMGSPCSSNNSVKSTERGSKRADGSANEDMRRLLQAMGGNLEGSYGCGSFGGSDFWCGGPRSGGDDHAAPSRLNTLNNGQIFSSATGTGITPKKCMSMEELVRTSETDRSSCPSPQTVCEQEEEAGRKLPGALHREATFSGIAKSPSPQPEKEPMGEFERKLECLLSRGEPEVVEDQDPYEKGINCLEKLCREMMEGIDDVEHARCELKRSRTMTPPLWRVDSGGHLSSLPHANTLPLLEAETQTQPREEKEDVQDSHTVRMDSWGKTRIPHAPNPNPNPRPMNGASPSNEHLSWRISSKDVPKALVDKIKTPPGENQTQSVEVEQKGVPCQSDPECKGKCDNFPVSSPFESPAQGTDIEDQGASSSSVPPVAEEQESPRPALSLVTNSAENKDGDSSNTQASAGRLDPVPVPVQFLQYLNSWSSETGDNFETFRNLCETVYGGERGTPVGDRIFGAVRDEIDHIQRQSPDLFDESGPLGRILGKFEQELGCAECEHIAGRLPPVQEECVSGDAAGGCGGQPGPSKGIKENANSGQEKEVGVAGHKQQSGGSGQKVCKEIKSPFAAVSDEPLEQAMPCVCEWSETVDDGDCLQDEVDQEQLENALLYHQFSDFVASGGVVFSEDCMTCASVTTGDRTDFVVSEVCMSQGVVQFDICCEELHGWAFVGIVGASDMNSDWSCCICECGSAYGWCNNSEVCGGEAHWFDMLKELIKSGTCFQIVVDCNSGTLTARFPRALQTGSQGLHGRHVVLEMHGLSEQNWKLAMEWEGYARFTIEDVKRLG